MAKTVTALAQIRFRLSQLVVVLAVRTIADTEDSDSNTTLSISHLQDQYSCEKQSAEIFLQRDKPDSG